MELNINLAPCEMIFSHMSEELYEPERSACSLVRKKIQVLSGVFSLITKFYNFVENNIANTRQ